MLEGIILLLLALIAFSTLMLWQVGPKKPRRKHVLHLYRKFKTLSPSATDNR